MTNDFSFILDNMKFSYSSASSYMTCPYGFRLTYIDAEERINNAFSDFGNLVHHTLELYFKGELETWDLSKYYQEHYSEYLQNPFPPYPDGMADNYYSAGLQYFENFDFDKSLYEVISIEDAIHTKYQDINLIIKPDLILKEKSTGEYHLIDYKTAKLKSGKNKIKQIEEYKKQFYLYCVFLWLERDIKIDKIKIWFIRDGAEEVIDVDPTVAQSTLEWFVDTVNKIKAEEDWNHNNTKENNYFCQNICSVRMKCNFR